MSNKGVALLRAAVVVSMVVTTAYYWYWNARYTQTRTAVASLQHKTSFPPVLNGFKFNSRGLTLLRRSGVASDVASGSQKLVIVASDSCQPCLELVPKWRDLLKRGFNGEIWLVAASGQTLVVGLWPVVEERRQPARMFVVNQAQEFQLASGIMTTPSMVLLDSDNRVRLVTNRLDQESLDGLAAHLLH